MEVERAEIESRLNELSKDADSVASETVAQLPFDENQPRSEMKRTIYDKSPPDFCTCSSAFPTNAPRPSTIHSFLSGKHETSSTISGRKVLYISPRTLPHHSLKESLSFAASCVLQDNDQITFLSSTDETDGDESIIQIPGSDQNALMQSCPTIFKALNEGPISMDQYCTKIINGHDLKWSLTQEFQGPFEFNLVIIPSPTSDKRDVEFEKFVIDTSPVPVALVKYNEAV